MKTLVRPEEQAAVLALFRGAQAKIWMFDVSHRRLAIMLSGKAVTEIVYIVAVGCEHMSGPFSWKDADLSINTKGPDQWGELRREITDAKAEFELTCFDVAIVIAPATELNKSFDHFLGDYQKYSNS